MCAANRESGSSADQHAAKLDRTDDAIDFHYSVDFRTNGGLYEKVITTENLSTTSTERCYVGNNYLEVDCGGSSPIQYYLLRDHLGSIASITNSSGTEVDDMAFDPYGLRREGDWSEPLLLTAANLIADAKTARGFTHHEHLDRTGFIHMNGRLYDPVIGRFLSADPFVTDPFNSQSYNRYSYVVNNPLSSIDPTGYFTLNLEGDDVDEIVVIPPTDRRIDEPPVRTYGEKIEGRIHPDALARIMRGFTASNSVRFSSVNVETGFVQAEGGRDVATTRVVAKRRQASKARLDSSATGGVNAYFDYQKGLEGFRTGDYTKDQYNDLADPIVVGFGVFTGAIVLAPAGVPMAAKVFAPLLYDLKLMFIFQNELNAAWAGHATRFGILEARMPPSGFAPYVSPYRVPSTPAVNLAPPP